MKVTVLWNPDERLLPLSIHNRSDVVKMEFRVLREHGPAWKVNSDGTLDQGQSIPARYLLEMPGHSGHYADSFQFGVSAWWVPKDKCTVVPE